MPSQEGCEDDHLIPNILFICADDLNGWIGPLSRYAGVKTPNIDELAARGTTFTHAYCAAPHCNPSRASVFSGQRPSTTGVYHGEPLGDAPRRLTLPEQFRRSGYETFGAGKVFHGQFDYGAATHTRSARAAWQDTHNRRELWDEFYPCIDEPLPAGRPLNALVDFNSGDEVPHWYQHFDWGVLPDDEEASMPDAEVVRRVTAFLERPHAQPFFCAVGLYRPHLPWYVPRRFFDYYPLDSISLPDVLDSDLDEVPEMAREWAQTPDDHDLVTRHGQWRHAVQGYLAAISYCDERVGELMRSLDAAGLAQDTVVVLWGDNGFHLGEKLHWRKFTLWEEATRVPLLVAAPGYSRPGHRYDEPVSLLDLYPTLLTLAGIKSEAELEGTCLAAALGASPLREDAPPISTWLEGNHSVRTRDWRYTCYADGSEELYDHRDDPRERRNLAARADLAETKRSLSRYLQGL